jgi:hypothetical protein
LRACIEVEANCKGILKENGYKKKGDWTMSDYKKIETSHHLSAFQVKVPHWRRTNKVRTPFASLATGSSPAWYQAYNATKHDRHLHFSKASFANAVEAVCGVQVLLAAQFLLYEFDPTSPPLRRDNDSEMFWPAQGSFFTVRFPDDWPQDQRYDLTDWQDTERQPDPIQRYPYS